MNKPDLLFRDFAQQYPDLCARNMARGSIDEIGQLLETLPGELAASIASRLPMSRIMALCEQDGFDFQALLESASIDDATAIVALLPRERRLQLVNALSSRGRRRRLLQFLNYPANSIGALVSDSLVRVDAETSMDELLEELRQPEYEEERPAVVVEEDSHYLGLLNLWRLTIHGTDNAVVRDFAESVAPLSPGMLAANAALAEGWRHHDWLPVVDHDSRVLGVAARSRVFAYLTGDSNRVSTMQASVSDMGSVFLRTMNEFLSWLLTPGRAR